VIAVSAAAVERLRTGYGLDPARCRVLLNAVLDHGPRTSDPTGDRFEAVCIGRLERSKDHALVLEAVARMCPSMRDRCHMRIIGEGRERKHLEEMIGRLGLGATVELAGNLPEDVVLAGLSRADVFVHPSTIDNCPFVILEALSLGVPIIATRVGGIPELIEDGQEGLLIDKRDVAALIEALETLVTKPDLRSALGSRGRRRFLSEFEMSGWVERAAALVLEDLPTT
jgi:glycosyltransferase involved in cell wall biosynthesis